MTKKYLKIDIYSQKEDRKLLMIKNQYNSITMKYLENSKFVRQYTKSTN